MSAPTPSFPSRLEDLAPWQVWADQQIEVGDKLGALVSTDLGLGAEPAKASLVKFRRFAHSLCRVPRVFEASWLLGHVRHLTVKPARPMRMTLQRLPPVLDGGDVLTLRDTLASPRLGLLESLELAVRADGLRRRWREAAARLPPTCRTLVLSAAGYSEPDAAQVLLRLPAQLTRLRLEPSFGTRSEWFVDDRLEWLDLRSVDVGAEALERLSDALARTKGVQLILGDAVAGAQGVSRFRWGLDDDAWLIDEQSDQRRLLERSPVILLQRRFGVISAMGQLLRRVPETWGFVERGMTRLAPWAGDTFTRRADGSWWVRQVHTATPEHRAVVVDGAPPTEPIVPLANGARVVIDGRVWRFSSARRAG